MESTKVNKKYKDRLFRLIFSKQEDLLALYNAVNGSSYENPGDLEINTLDDVIYMGMKNDASFLLDNVLNLYEQQSSFNPNMPVRGLSYFTKLYQQYISAKELNVYSSKLLRLPFPQYVVFYNGLKKEPERLELRLSDSFGEYAGKKPSLEVSALMLNINQGYNGKLMEQCRQLKDYSRFVAEVRRQKALGYETREAAGRAVDQCVKEGILAQILSKYREEVIDMLFTEYDEQKHMASEREEGREEGRQEGREEGEFLHIIKFVRKKMEKGISAEECAELLEEDIATIREIFDTITAHPDWNNMEIYERIEAEC